MVIGPGKDGITSQSASGASQVNWHRFDDPQEAGEGLAKQVALWLQLDLQQQRRVTLALSGGSTPGPFFQALARQDLPWQCIDVLPVDERWVPQTHPDSNERLIRQQLLHREASRARFHSLYNGAATPGAAEAAMQRQLQALSWPLSVAVLGMGEDGHTASWFPGAPDLACALSPPPGVRVCAQHPPGDRRGRMTLTAPVILQAHRRVLHLTGAAKRQVFEQALAAPSQCEVMPVRVLLSHPLEIFWSPL